MAVEKICCFLFFAIIGSVAAYDFEHVYCADLVSKKHPETYSSLIGAVKTCVAGNRCIGVRQLSPTKFSVLYDLQGIVLNETCSDTYLFDRSDGVNLPNAPNTLHEKLVFAIYTEGECPIGLKPDAYVCNAKIGSISEQRCKGYPGWMEAHFDPATKLCSVVKKETLIKNWS